MLDVADMVRRMILSTPELEALERLGRSLRLARLRRNFSQAELGERMGVARGAVAALEDGSAGSSVGVLLKALTVLGYTERLGDLVASDPIGDDIDIAIGRRRAGRYPDVAPF